MAKLLSVLLVLSVLASGCGELAQLCKAAERGCERQQECAPELGFSGAFPFSSDCGERADYVVEFAQDQDAVCIEALTNFEDCKAQAECVDIAACEFRSVVDACDFSPP